jgi:hypothetical protein
MALRIAHLSEVEFREAITSSIPSFITLLENEDGSIRGKTVDLIDKLANHGE